MLQVIEVVHGADCDLLNQNRDTLRRKAAIVHSFLQLSGRQLSELPASQIRLPFTMSLRRLRRLTYLTQLPEHLALADPAALAAKPRRGPHVQILHSMRAVVLSDAEFNGRYKRYQPWLRRQLRKAVYQSEEGAQLLQTIEDALGPYAVLVSEEELFEMIDMSKDARARAIKRLTRWCDEMPLAALDEQARRRPEKRLL